MLAVVGVLCGGMMPLDVRAIKTYDSPHPRVYGGRE
jgi:hypothetical protein